jgi:hypothetical protein
VVGTTLLDIRDHIEDLSTDGGRYYLRCARTGDRPVPAVGARFPDRCTARDAARATEQYRSTLRQYDPQVPYYDVVVCEDTGPMVSPREVCDCGSKSAWDLSTPVLERDGREPDRNALIEFCHRLAAAVFETLSATVDDAVEMAVMDTYFEQAECIESRDQLCLCLLESMASEIDAHLDPDEQATLLETAASRLDVSGLGDPTGGGADPIEATFEELRCRGVVGEYRCRPAGFDPGANARRVVVECSTYALREREGHLAVLPIVLECYRRNPTWPPTTIEVEPAEEGWRITVELSGQATPERLSTVPVTTDAPNGS